MSRPTPERPVSFALKPPTCLGCPAHQKGFGFVPPAVPLDPTRVELAVVGQGPGQQEAETSRPFLESAPSGFTLTRWLHGEALQRSTVWVGNTIQCWLPKGRTQGRWFGSTDPTRAMQQHCWNAHVGPSLAALPKLRLVIPVGAPARSFLMGSTYGERYCGTFTKLPLPTLGENHAQPAQTDQSAVPAVD